MGGGGANFDRGFGGLCGEGRSGRFLRLFLWGRVFNLGARGPNEGAGESPTTRLEDKRCKGKRRAQQKSYVLHAIGREEKPPS